MNRRPDEPTQSNGGIDPGSDRGIAGGHLTADQLNAYLDRAVSLAEGSSIDTHLASCADCDASLAELRATRALLQALPTPVPSRSFRLGPEYAHSRDSIWDRFGAWLMPAFPALRAATVAVALLLAAVSARNVLDNPASSGPTGDTAMIAQYAQTALPAETVAGQNSAAIESNQNGLAPTVQPTMLPYADTGETTLTKEPPQTSESDQLPVPEMAESAGEAANDADLAVESEPALDADSGAGGAAVPESGAPLEEGDDAETDVVTVDEAGADSTAQESTSLRVDDGASASGNATEPEEDEPSMAMVVEPTQGASPPATASATPTATATATATPTATATATATAVPPSPAPEPTPAPVAAATAGSDQWDFWNVAQLTLAILLVTMIALVGMVALRRRNVSK